MFRSHGTDTPREIWNFGEPGTMFYDALEKCIRLRYRLLPYTYSLAGKVMLRDYIMFRSFLFDFPGDETACEMGSQFMYGDFLLVCPVTEPMYYEPENCSLETKKQWNCYLPSGFCWYDFKTGVKYEGGQWVIVAADFIVLLNAPVAEALLVLQLSHNNWKRSVLSPYFCPLKSHPVPYGNKA